MTPLVFGQQVITLENPSFEDIPRRGLPNNLPIAGWHDCGLSVFPGESPPDIHPAPDRAWSVSAQPIDGNTYIGMVTRANDSWESVSQALSGIIEGGKCYKFSCYLVQSPEYKSKTARTIQNGTEIEENFDRPAVLRIWGGNSFCDKNELLGESPSIQNANWKLYTYTFQPKRSHRYIIFEAFYKTPILEAYNGHILLDALSDIEETPCPIFPKGMIADVSDPPAKVIIGTKASSGSSASTIKKSGGTSSGTVKSGTISSGTKSFKPVLLKDFIFDKMFVGQKLRLDHLYFKSDSMNLQPDSYKVLDELAEFLITYPKVVIEIGGHTNTVPPDSFCDHLSTQRAKAVQQYLVGQGVPETRLQYKGYGKTEPLILYDKYNKEARLKNQRVEIKILKLT